MLTEDEYRLIYYQLFGKKADHHKGWCCWREAVAKGWGYNVLHPIDTTPPEQWPDDYWIFATHGPLRYLAHRSGQRALPR